MSRHFGVHNFMFGTFVCKTIRTNVCMLCLCILYLRIYCWFSFIFYFLLVSFFLYLILLLLLFCCCLIFRFCFYFLTQNLDYFECLPSFIISLFYSFLYGTLFFLLIFFYGAWLLVLIPLLLSVILVLFLFFPKNVFTSEHNFWHCQLN